MSDKKNYMLKQTIRNHRTLATLLLVGTALLAASVAWATWPHRSPAIEWIPPSISETVLAGTTKTISVSFVPSRHFREIRFDASPQLEEILRIEPVKLDNVRRGRTYYLDLIVMSSPSDLPEIFGGSVFASIEQDRPWWWRWWRWQNHQFSERFGRLAERLSVSVEVIWSGLSQEDIGVALAYPPTWHANSRSGTLTISNVAEPSDDVSLDALLDESFFQVRVRYGDNPRGLPISEWFNQVVRPVVFDVLESESLTTIDGRVAYEAQVSGFGGTQKLVYVPDGNNIIRITYGLFAPQFLDTYSSILESLEFSP